MEKENNSKTANVGRFGIGRVISPGCERQDAQDLFDSAWRAAERANETRRRFSQDTNDTMLTIRDNGTTIEVALDIPWEVAKKAGLC
jgi:hypothetical protein